jgi:phenylalanyl-tRNA synthetase beta chain
MKISLEWLAEYLPGGIAAEAAAEALTHGGLPVENHDQHVIDVEVTSNRGDCLSHLGVARELSALLDRPFEPVAPSAVESSTPASSAAAVAIEAADLCPHYTARLIRNVKVGPSPDWLVRRLQAVIQYKDEKDNWHPYKPINNVVDVTNYVMFEMGQPLHAFDFDKLRGRRIVVRRARAGEGLRTLDGKERGLDASMLVIADADRPVALAGVMGGQETEVAGQTVNILLESARFDPLSVRKTARALAMGSDSSHRFERQIDPTLPERAGLRAAQLILETAGGELMAGVVSAGGAGFTPKVLTLRFARVEQILGVAFARDRIVKALARQHLAPAVEGDRVRVTVPSWRLDLNIEADLVEEVARTIGYANIPTRDQIQVRVTPAGKDDLTIRTIRDALVAAGYFEAITVSFVADNLAGDFVPPEAQGLLRADRSVRKDHAKLRPSILPGLLEAVRRNETVGTPGARLFELGSTFWIGEGGKTDERRRLALVGGSDYRETRGAVEALLNKLDATRPVNVVPAQRPGFAAGAAGVVEWGGQPVGHIGRVDRAVAERLSLRDLPTAAELDLRPLLANAQHVPQLLPPPRFPAVDRDVSLVLKDDVRYASVDALIRSLSLPDLEEVEYVTTYRGKPLEKGTKSLSVHLRFRSPTATLTSEAVEASVQRAIAAAKEKLGATLRA